MDLDEFINGYSVEVGDQLRAVRSALIERYPGLQEQPDFPSRILVYRLAPGNEGVVFTLIPSRTGVKLGIYRGRDLADPEGRFTGSGKVHTTVSLADTSFDDQAFIKLLDAAMSNAQLRVDRKS